MVMLGSIAITGRRARANKRAPPPPPLHAPPPPWERRSTRRGDTDVALASRRTRGAEDDRHVRLPTGWLSSVVARLQPDGGNGMDDARGRKPTARALDGSIAPPPPPKDFEHPPRRSPLSTSLSPPIINNLYSPSSHVRHIEDYKRVAQIHHGTIRSSMMSSQFFTFHFHRRRYPNIQL